MLTDNELIEEIKRCWNPWSSRAGILIQRFDGFWHYGVALSDNLAVSWGPIKASQVHNQGFLDVHECGHEFRNAIQVPYLTKDEIFKSLIASVSAFHNKWDYGFQGWNCEHWARLVVSGQPISYQVKEQVCGMFDAFGVLCFRGEAIEQLNKYKVERW